MHRIATQPGGWTPETEGLMFVEQTPAPLVILTTADTDIQVLAAAIAGLPPNFPALRVVNLLQLQQNLAIDLYAEQVLSQAQGIVLRLLGGRAYWSYGLEVVKQTSLQTGATLFVIPGDDRPDPELSSHATASLAACDRLWRYFTEGGIDNSRHALQFLSDTCLATQYHPPAPMPIARVGIYPFTPHFAEALSASASPSPRPLAGLLFYRAHYLAGNTAPIDALCQALVDQGLQPLPVFVSSLRDLEVQAELLRLFQVAPGGISAVTSPKTGEQKSIQVLLNATSFSLARLEAESPQVEFWQQLDVPVLQVILSGGTREQWENQTRGLSPRDMAMNVALPEVDGRIISRAISFKTVQARHPQLETDVVGYEPVSDRVEFVAALAANWVKLRQTPVAERRIALILANYPTRDGRLANGVGLDTPASCVEILQAMQRSGYTLTDVPRSGDELIQRLTAGVTNDPEGEALRSIQQAIAWTDYQQYFAQLPAAVQQGICSRWGDPADAAMGESLPIAGLQLGNLFIGIQPARGYDLDPSLNYHAPDLEPTHAYLAFYDWLRHHFGAQAIAHIGKHGNLEWLPGKGVALSDCCYPEVALGALPHLYPFIVNDPGEGAQAKRRSQAVILDHLTPPMTRAELYGCLHQLESLVDEYYEAQSLNPSRLPALRDRILSLIQQENLEQELDRLTARFGNPFATELDTELDTELATELATEPATPGADAQTASHPLNRHLPVQQVAQSQAALVNFEGGILNRLDGYLCELKEAQIRDGLHIFGHCPTGTQLRDLIIAIARHPSANRPGLTQAIAQSWQLPFDPLSANPTDPIPPSFSLPAPLPPCRHLGDLISALEQTAIDLITPLISSPPDLLPLSPALPSTLTHWLTTDLLPALHQTRQEVTHFLHALNGGYIPSGASGAPTRGRPEVLPTGRNFYSVDIRAIPTESAWDVGRKAAEGLIEQYTQTQGEYPRSIALSIWGTSTMRTGGDDLAEALALLGVQPVWDGTSRRVVDFEILPLAILQRPRVDVTLRISGFFRDAFPNLIDLFQQAVNAIADLDEPPELNPLATQVQQDAQTWQSGGLPIEQAMERSRYRIFGAKPGAYGAGLQGLIESQNWQTDADLARAYINWSSYAYTGKGEGRSASAAFETRLRNLQIVLHNQDNREHDLLDSDDYYQFQGGLTVAVRSLTGCNPAVYFGDHAMPAHPKLRTLAEEIARVYRSRVVNPKWIAGVMRHGYKGAFEMAATVDYLFAYDATTKCIENYMYAGIAQAYLLDEAVQSFVQAKNPWALRDMAERLLEAQQRGLWQDASLTLLEQLRSIVHQAEGAIEQRGQG